MENVYHLFINWYSGEASGSLSAYKCRRVRIILRYTNAARVELKTLCKRVPRAGLIHGATSVTISRGCANVKTAFFFPYETCMMMYSVVNGPRNRSFMQRNAINFRFSAGLIFFRCPLKRDFLCFSADCVYFWTWTLRELSFGFHEKTFEINKINSANFIAKKKFKISLNFELLLTLHYSRINSPIAQSKTSSIRNKNKEILPSSMAIYFEMLF